MASSRGVPDALDDLLRRLGGHWSEVIIPGGSQSHVLRRSTGDQYLKVAPTRQPELAQPVDEERHRLDWLQGRGLPVPDLLAGAREADLTWILTSAVPGTPASAPWPVSDRSRVMTVIGEALRALHELDPTDCPFDHSPAAELALAGQAGADRAELARLEASRPNGKLVLGHGDYCLPNVLVTARGTAYLIDLGGFGLADRHRDLASALGSILGDRNPQFDHTHGEAFLDAYGRDAVAQRDLRWATDLKRLY